MQYIPGGRKSYEASQSFEPAFYKPDYRDARLPTQRIAQELFDEERSRANRSIAAIARSLRCGKALRMRYVDWQNKTTRREIQPVAWIVIDGEQPAILHAYCHLRRAYRSFELSRMSDFTLTDREYDQALLDSPEGALTRIRIGRRPLTIPISCVYPVIARAYSAASLRDTTMKAEIRAAVERVGRAASA